MKDSTKDSTKDNKAVFINALQKGDEFMFQGDVKKDHYFFRKCDGMYAQVVSNANDMEDAEKWAFVGCSSVVIPIDK